MNRARDITIRIARPEDAEAIITWGAEHIEDQRVLLYPTTQILCAENGTPLVYAPMHGVLVIDSLASKEGVPRGTQALALREIVHAARQIAGRVGIKEILFFTGPDDGKLERLASRHGFEKLPFQGWRMRLE
jgi:hypothetical protein